MTTAIEAKNEFEVMDALDEGQIVDEIKGHVIEQYFYEFPQGNRQVVGISWAGIKYVARKMAEAGHPISIEEKHLTVTNDSYIVEAAAMDLVTKEKRWGVAECPKYMKLKEGDEKPDPFALQKAFSKAQRNAIRNFIPETAIQEGYKAWKASKSTGDRIEQAFGKDRLEKASKGL